MRALIVAAGGRGCRRRRACRGHRADAEAFATGGEAAGVDGVIEVAEAIVGDASALG